jgi:hypothetical protein
LISESEMCPRITAASAAGQKKNNIPHTKLAVALPLSSRGPDPAG